MLCVVCGVASSEEPALPAGLGDTDKSEPSLPAGLDNGKAAPEEPALPAGLAEETKPAEEPKDTVAEGTLPFALHGYWEGRGGLRLGDDPAQRSDAVLGETRLQLESEYAWERAAIDVTADLLLDGVLEEGDLDLRQLRLTWSPLETVDLRIGRQVLTWGTGDLVFINDLFPKDWIAFLSGRNVEYLKAPSDAVKLGWYGDALNAELVYTPQFDPDRFITGERISFYNPLFHRHDGYERPVAFNAPSDWFSDDEFALRLYRTVGAWEFAAYGYSGYWKSPAEQRLWPPLQARFPRLNVYGASARGAVGKGVVNAEIGYYDSRDDSSGRDPFVDNGEFRLLLGYEREIAKELTLGLQYYLEHMLDYGAYRATRIPLIVAADEDRHLLTLRLTKLLMNQNLTVSGFLYYSPSDDDFYFRPAFAYKLSDRWLLEGGANLFRGARDHTFFGQFEPNNNVYAALRWSF